MSITKDSKEWTQALALVPPTKEDLGPDCHIAHPGARCPDRRPPDITPDLLYAILEAAQTRYRSFIWEISEALEYDESMPLADAIIRAAASLQEAA